MPILFRSLHFVAIVATPFLVSACAGRVASRADDSCSTCQIGTADSGACQADSVAVSQYGPVGIAVAGADAFWANYGRGVPNDASVMKVDLRGGDPVVLVPN